MQLLGKYVPQAMGRDRYPSRMTQMAQQVAHRLGAHPNAILADEQCPLMRGGKTLTHDQPFFEGVRAH